MQVCDQKTQYVLPFIPKLVCAAISKLIGIGCSAWLHIVGVQEQVSKDAQIATKVTRATKAKMAEDG